MYRDRGTERKRPETKEPRQRNQDKGREMRDRDTSSEKGMEIEPETEGQLDRWSETEGQRQKASNRKAETERQRQKERDRGTQTEGYGQRDMDKDR